MILELRNEGMRCARRNWVDSWRARHTASGRLQRNSPAGGLGMTRAARAAGWPMPACRGSVRGSGDQWSGRAARRRRWRRRSNHMPARDSNLHRQGAVGQGKRSALRWRRRGQGPGTQRAVHAAVHKGLIRVITGRHPFDGAVRAADQLVRCAVDASRCDGCRQEQPVPGEDKTRDGPESCRLAHAAIITMLQRRNVPANPTFGRARTGASACRSGTPPSAHARRTCADARTRDCRSGLLRPVRGLSRRPDICHLDQWNSSASRPSARRSPLPPAPLRPMRPSGLAGRPWPTRLPSRSPASRSILQPGIASNPGSAWPLHDQAAREP